MSGLPGDAVFSLRRAAVFLFGASVVIVAGILYRLHALRSRVGVGPLARACPTPGVALCTCKPQSPWRREARAGEQKRRPSHVDQVDSIEHCGHWPSKARPF